MSVAENLFRMYPQKKEKWGFSEVSRAMHSGTCLQSQHLAETGRSGVKPAWTMRPHLTKGGRGGPEGSSLVNGIGCPQRGFLEGAHLLLFCLCHSGFGVPPLLRTMFQTPSWKQTAALNSLILDFSTSRLLRNKFLFFLITQSVVFWYSSTKWSKTECISCDSQGSSHKFQPNITSIDHPGS